MIYTQGALAAAFAGAMFFAASFQTVGGQISILDHRILMPLCGLGAVIGGFTFHFFRPPRNPTWRNIALRWLVSSATSIVCAPAVIEYLAAERQWTQVTPARVFFISAAMSFAAWGILTFVHRKLNAEGIAAVFRAIFKP